MNIKQNNNKKIIALWASLLLFLAVAAAIIYIYVFNGSIFGWSNHDSSKVNSVDYSKPSKEQISSGKQIEESNASTSPSQVGSDRAPQPSGTEVNKATTPLTITNSNQSGNIVQVRTLISALTNTGTCTITFTNQAKTVSKTSEVQSLSSSTTCKGFDVPINELSVGTWQYSINFENETMKGSASGSITIQQVTQ